MFIRAKVATLKYSPAQVHRSTDADGNTIYEIEVPGVDPTDIDLHTQGEAIRCQFSRNETEGAVFLNPGNEFDLERTTADLKHGMLTVRVPPKKEHRKKKIPIALG